MLEIEMRERVELAELFLEKFSLRQRAKGYHLVESVSSTRVQSSQLEPAERRH